LVPFTTSGAGPFIEAAFTGGCVTQSTDADAVSAVGLVAAWALDHALAAEKALAALTAGGATGAELVVTALAVAAVVIAHVIPAVMTRRATMPAVECDIR